jgi:hypothetical protein
MNAGLLENKPYRLLLPVISALSYGLGGLTVSWVMAILFPQSAQDRVATRFWAFVFAFLVWLLGAAYVSGGVSPAKQLRWWPISILLAALHGGVVVLAVALLGTIKTPDIKSAAIFALIGAIAAAFSYTYFLMIVWIIGKRAALPVRPPPF